jgi:cell wall-associated NlpC family hydrolase
VQQTHVWARLRATISAAGTNVHDGFLYGHPIRVPKAATEGPTCDWRATARAALACRWVSTGSDTTVQPGSRGGLPLSWRLLAGALGVVAIAVVAALLLGGGGHSTPAGAAKVSVAQGSGKAARPSAGGKSGGVEKLGSSGRSVHAARPGTANTSPGAGAARSPTGAHAKSSAIPSATGGGSPAAASKGVAVAEVRDPEESKSFPLPASVHHARASTPSVAAEAAVAPGAASDSEIRKELGEEEKAKAQEQAAQRRVLTPVAGGFSVGGNGTIPIPTDVPEAVQRVVAGGNAIADFPYIWGGGHASFVANGYDCSGSVSYALAAGGLLSAPLVSGDLAHWGEPGPGRWITIYANDGHTFMDVDGVWFDTAGRSGPYASRWLVSQPSLEGYAVRHPPGL